MPDVTLSDPSIYLLMHGVLIFVGVWHGIHLVRQEALRRQSDPAQFMDLCVVVLIAAAVGSRLPYVVHNARSLIADPLEMVRIWHGGIEYYGGLIMAFICGLIFVRRKKLPVWQTADIFAPAAAIGIFWGKLGYIGLGFARGHELYRIYLLSPARFDWLNVYAVQGLLAIVHLLIYFVLVAIRRKNKFAGQLFWVYVMLSSGSITLVNGLWKMGYLSWLEVISLPKSITGFGLVFTSAVVLMVFNNQETHQRRHRWKEDISPASGAAKCLDCDGGHSIQTK